MLRRILTAPDTTPYDSPMRYVWPTLLLAAAGITYLAR